MLKASNKSIFSLFFPFVNTSVNTIPFLFFPVSASRGLKTDEYAFTKKIGKDIYNTDKTFTKKKNTK